MDVFALLVLITIGILVLDKVLRSRKESRKGRKKDLSSYSYKELSDSYSKTARNRRGYNKESWDNSREEHSEYAANIRAYNKERIGLMVRGIWAERSRIQAFQELTYDDVLYLKFEPDNPHDKNAIAVRSKKGRLLGYIKRNQRKLIKTLKVKPNNIAFVREKDQFFSQNHQREVYRLNLDVWLGFENEELKAELARRKQEKEYRERREDISRKIEAALDEYPLLKKRNPGAGILVFAKLCQMVQESNEERLVTDTQWAPMKPPLEQLTVLTSHIKDHKATIEYFNRFADETCFTEKQLAKLRKRKERAEEKLKSIIITEEE